MTDEGRVLDTYGILVSGTKTLCHQWRDAMSDPFGNLLRLTPRCQVARCRRNGSVHVEITNPTWKKAQQADICPAHLAPFTVQAEGAGCVVRAV